MSTGGVLLIDKPEGITSNGVLDRIKLTLRDRFGVKTRELPKLGHTGTLDPFATGLLPIVVGDAAKLSRYILGSTKTYEATLRLGIQTASGDLTGDPIKKCEVPPNLKRETLEDALRSLSITTYFQVPPMVSAKKQNGVPLYELARKGQIVERKPVACQIHSFQLRDFSGEDLPFIVCVSAGTYIRTLGEDLARSVGTCGHLVALRRTGISNWNVDDAMSLTQLKDRIENHKRSESSLDLGAIVCDSKAWITFDRVLSQKLPHHSVSFERAIQIAQGRKSAVAELGLKEGVNALTHENHLIATVMSSEGRFTIERVMWSVDALQARFGKGKP